MGLPDIERLTTGDGQDIAYRRYETGAPPRAVAIIASAMGVAQHFYGPFAQWLAAEGVAVYTFDYRGTGASRPAAGLRGYGASIEDWWKHDCAALIDEAAARYPDAPLFWIGHSIGGQIFGLVPNHTRVQAMLSIATGSGYYRFNAAPLRYYVPLLWLVLAPLALRSAGYFPGKRLGFVGDLPHDVMKQWRRWCLSPTYLGVESTLRATLSQVTTPITVFSMQDDEMMTLRGTRELYALYERALVSVQRLRPRELGVPAIGHFGFFRASMQKPLWPRALTWLDQALASPRTAAA
ncbi:MAG: alpha/beta fold hydrolase [Polyangiales bacterium]